MISHTQLEHELNSKKNHISQQLVHDCQTQTALLSKKVVDKQAYANMQSALEVLMSINKNIPDVNLTLQKNPEVKITYPSRNEEFDPGQPIAIKFKTAHVKTPYSCLVVAVSGGVQTPLIVKKDITTSDYAITNILQERPDALKPGQIYDVYTILYQDGHILMDSQGRTVLAVVNGITIRLAAKTRLLAEMNPIRLGTILDNSRTR